jgi:hypothetical protein
MHMQVKWDDAGGGEEQSSINAWEVYAANRCAEDILAHLKRSSRALDRARLRLSKACFEVMALVCSVLRLEEWCYLSAAVLTFIRA